MICPMQIGGEIRESYYIACMKLPTLHYNTYRPFDDHRYILNAGLYQFEFRIRVNNYNIVGWEYVGLTYQDLYK